MIQPQYMEALDRANEIRYARAQLKQDIKAGDVSVGDVLADPPGYVDAMLIFDLLYAQRQWGRKKVLTVLAAIPVRESRSVGQLTARQRRLITEALA